MKTDLQKRCGKFGVPIGKSELPYHARMWTNLVKKLLILKMPVSVIQTAYSSSYHLKQ